MFTKDLTILEIRCYTGFPGKWKDGKDDSESDQRLHRISETVHEY